MKMVQKKTNDPSGGSTGIYCSSKFLKGTPRVDTAEYIGVKTHAYSEASCSHDALCQCRFAKSAKVIFVSVIKLLGQIGFRWQCIIAFAKMRLF